MKVDVVGKTKIYNKDKLVAESNYHGHAFASGKFEITEQQANKARMLRDVEKYLSRHPEVWDILADKLFGDFVNYKNVPFSDKELRGVREKC